MRHSILHTTPGMRKITLDAVKTQRGTISESVHNSETYRTSTYTPAIAYQDEHSVASSLQNAVQGGRNLPPPRTKLIVVVDDSPTIRKIVETTLTQEGYETRGFPDAIEAIKWFAETPAHTPDLMLVDIGLPKLSGCEFIRRIKTKPRFAHTTCIILSRRDGMVDRLKGRLAGAKAYIMKPFTIQEFLTTIHEYMADGTDGE